MAEIVTNVIQLPEVDVQMQVREEISNADFLDS